MEQVLVVEDDDNIRERICRVIGQTDELEILAQANSLKAAHAILETKTPSLALIDLGLPDGSGTRLIELLTTKNIPSLVLTVFGDETNVVSAIRAGACGYLLKSEDPNKIGSMLLEVIDGGSPISPAVARHVLKQVRKDKLAPDTAGQAEESAPRLTPTELEVLQLIAKGYTSPEIAALTNRAPSTILVHVRNIYRKLSVHNRGEAVYEAMNMGLILSG